MMGSVDNAGDVAAVLIGNWNKMGETHAAEVVSVYGDKQSAWAVWRDEGVGCLMCYNHRLALERAVTSLNAGKTWATCPWTDFGMLILNKLSLVRHEKTMQHQKAVAFQATGKLLVAASS